MRRPRPDKLAGYLSPSTAISHTLAFSSIIVAWIGGASAGWPWWSIVVVAALTVLVVVVETLSIRDYLRQFDPAARLVTDRLPWWRVARNYAEGFWWQLSRPWCTPKEHRKPWRDARTFDDLCELTARWLTREFPYHPGYPSTSFDDGPDPETDLIADRLAAANRAGFLTHFSQPGDTWTYEGREYSQCAQVGGFCVDQDVLQALIRAARDAGLLLCVHPPASRPGGIAYTAESDPAACWHCEPGRTISEYLLLSDCVPHCGETAQDAVLDAWQVCITDPELGRADRFDAALDAFIAARNLERN